MSVHDHTERQRELLCERALNGLPPEEERELATLRREDPSLDDDSYERAAAALHLAFLSTSMSKMPGRLRERLTRDANTRFAAVRRDSRPVGQED